MKIGYPCLNYSIGCTANSTFRLRNFTEKRFIDTVKNNIDCLKRILSFNIKNDILFFRISSDIIPFASHPICTFDWKNYFEYDFEIIGKMIIENDIRISMHPDQFVLLNAKNEEIVKRSIKEIEWHCELLDSLNLDEKAKVQIHVGGIYDDKENSIKRFLKTYSILPRKIKKRFVIENDDRLYSLKDCLRISKKAKIPIVFDSFHHNVLNNNESTRDAVIDASKTWKKSDGILMVDYSSQQKNSKTGKHSEHIDIIDFKNFLKITKGIEYDIMLEIKDKEKSALEALKVLK
ncbi:MAG: UV DNA damage repair endonuclease UvsE [Candidatus Aenigmarchaeota archaeon]|nr:UV DNA damage repair endonuclease UvsE [Candidatus Aenigmarchaeota archaeon]